MLDADGYDKAQKSREAFGFVIRQIPRQERFTTFRAWRALVRVKEEFMTDWTLRFQCS